MLRNRRVRWLWTWALLRNAVLYLELSWNFNVQVPTIVQSSQDVRPKCPPKKRESTEDVVGSARLGVDVQGDFAGTFWIFVVVARCGRMERDVLRKCLSICNQYECVQCVICLCLCWYLYTCVLVHHYSYVYVDVYTYISS